MYLAPCGLINPLITIVCTMYVLYLVLCILSSIVSTIVCTIVLTAWLYDGDNWLECKRCLVLLDCLPHSHNPLLRPQTSAKRINV